MQSQTDFFGRYRELVEYFKSALREDKMLKAYPAIHPGEILTLFLSNSNGLLNILQTRERKEWLDYEVNAFYGMRISEDLKETHPELMVFGLPEINGNYHITSYRRKGDGLKKIIGARPSVIVGRVAPGLLSGNRVYVYDRKLNSNVQGSIFEANQATGLVIQGINVCLREEQERIRG